MILTVQLYAPTVCLSPLAQGVHESRCSGARCRDHHCHVSLRIEPPPPSCSRSIQLPSSFCRSLGLTSGLALLPNIDETTCRRPLLSLICQERGFFQQQRHLFLRDISIVTSLFTFVIIHVHHNTTTQTCSSLRCSSLKMPCVTPSFHRIHKLRPG